jgi:hypothetical protein
LILEVYAGASGELNFYEDDGESMAYQTDAGSRRRWIQRYEGDAHTLLCEPNQGSYSGMPLAQNFQIRWIGLSPDSQVEARGVEIEHLGWNGEILEIHLLQVPQTASLQLRVT